MDRKLTPNHERLGLGRLLEAWAAHNGSEWVTLGDLGEMLTAVPDIMPVGFWAEYRPGRSLRTWLGTALLEYSGGTVEGYSLERVRSPQRRRVMFRLRRVG